MSEEAVLTPITPEEGGSVPPKVTPFKAPEAAPAAPAAPAPAAPAASGPATIKLKPVIRKPMIRKPVIGGAPKPAAPAPAAPASPAPAASAPAPAAAAPAPKPAAQEAKKATQSLKKATQSLGAVTGEMPAQAVLRKTGIIAEGIITPAQQQAAKSKTSRISLESAIGVAPAKESAAPMKTIKLRRPTNLRPAAPSVLKPAAVPAAAPAAAPAETPAPAAETAAAEPDAGVTQKKTLKLQRPSSLGVKRPSLGIQKPAAPAADADVGDIPSLEPVGDVPELKPLSPFGLEAPQPETSAGVPAWVATMSIVTTLAALLVLGAVMYFLWSEGCGPVAGPNEMPFLQM